MLKYMMQDARSSHPGAGWGTLTTCVSELRVSILVAANYLPENALNCSQGKGLKLGVMEYLHGKGLFSPLT